MRSEGHDDELLRRYLLGKLPEDEAESLEGRLLADDDLFELSEAVEADLFAEYAEGGLGFEERESVRKRLASSPRGRERLAVARALKHLAASEAPGGSVLPFAPRTPARPSPHRWWVVLAAALLLAAGLSWVFLPRPPAAERVAERPVPTPAPAPQAHEAPRPPPPAPPPPPVKAVLQLSLLSLRGAESRAKLRIPADAGIVELQISVEGMEDLQSFHFTVRNESGKIVKEEKGLSPRTLQGVRAVALDLPVDRLPAGRYEIQVQGRTPGEEPEELSPLEVEVVREKTG